MAYNNHMEQIIIKTTPAFDKAAKKLISADSLELLYDYLTINPRAGDIIRGSGGLRKIRWQSNNKGKSGGARVLYHYSNDVLIIIIAAFSKSEKVNITQAEKNELKKLIPKLINMGVIKLGI